MNEDKIVTLQLTINQINVILAGLGKLTLESGLEVFQLVHKQVNEQVQPQQATEVSEPTKAKK
jgi:hypothetical protein